MKKLLLVGALALGGVSCAPDIKQDPPPDNTVAQFDPASSPAVVPLPNDLAINPATGLVNAPIDPSAPAAQQEFTRDYLNTLNGFPTSAVATTKIPDLDETTINANTVRFIDLLQGTVIATPSVTPTTSYDAATGTLSIAPPATGWPKGGRYAIALVGGPDGLKGKNGKPVVGSSVWGLASSSEPLVTCEDLTAPNCQTATEIIPSTETDPAAKLADQTAKALQLEQLRRAYRPLLDALEQQGVVRNDVVLLWTFRIMNMPEATFNLSTDPATLVVPFPNDLAIDPATGKVNLQAPPGASPLQQQLFQGLRTLDGFSTTSAIVSESSNTLGPIDTGSRLDPGSLEAGTRFIKLTPGGTQPNVKPCLSCVSSGPVSAANPQQLQFVPQVPLDEKSRYAVVMTTDLKDERGRKVAPAGAFALLRLANPVSVDGKSQVSGVPDALALALEPQRQAIKPLFDALEAAGIKRTQMVLAWSFTTQSTISDLAKLHAIPSQLPAQALPAAPLYLQDVTGTIRDTVMAGAGLPRNNIGKIFEGQIIVPNTLTGPGGTINPNPAQFRFERVQFLLALPAAAAPAEGYPVTIFSHGLRSHRNTALPILNALAAQGHATVAIDTVFHGDRSSCVGITAQSGIPNIESPDAACANSNQRCDTDAASPSYGRCISNTRSPCNPSSPATGDYTCSAAGQGRCIASSATEGLCEGGSFALDNNPTSPSRNSILISGWNMLNLTNLFSTRDNFRQHTVDHAQLARVLAGTGIDDQLTAQGSGKLDGNKINYLGQSLGSILGPLYTSVSPNVKNAAFNVPGSNLTGILLTSPAFATPRAGFLATLASNGINAGTAQFDQFIGLAKMILDPADPINYIYHVENSSTAPQGREAFIQYIAEDQVTPNPLTAELIKAANDRASTKKVATFQFTPTQAELPLDKRHGFLLDFSGNPAITTQAQTQIVNFLNTGTVAQ
ncbi:MAG TPA: hypothetical protein VF815_22915 [Myxococcaceae bacterium]